MSAAAHQLVWYGCRPGGLDRMVVSRGEGVREGHSFSPLGILFKHSPLSRFHVTSPRSSILLFIPLTQCISIYTLSLKTYDLDKRLSLFAVFPVFLPLTSSINMQSMQTVISPWSDSALRFHRLFALSYYST